MSLALTKAQIKEYFNRQADKASEGRAFALGNSSLVHIFAFGQNDVPSVCPFCGQDTGPGADMHRRCFLAATPGERFLVLDAQVEAMAEREGVSVEFARDVFGHQRRICQDCGRRWRLASEGWECPNCVNV